LNPGPQLASATLAAGIIPSYPLRCTTNLHSAGIGLHLVRKSYANTNVTPVTVRTLNHIFTRKTMHIACGIECMKMTPARTKAILERNGKKYKKKKIS